MITDKDIERINELYHKSKDTGLTPEEKEEQARLRGRYISVHTEPICVPSWIISR